MSITVGVIGPYFDGRAVRFADALVAYRILESKLGSPDQTLNVIDSAPPEEALKAEADLIAATREALGLLPFNPATGGGVNNLIAKRLGTELIARSHGDETVSI